MVTISQILEKKIRERPFLQEALARGIINNAALAEQMMPEIAKELGKDVKFSAVNMAIRRYAEKIKDTFVSKAKFDKNTDIVIRSDLVELVFHKEDMRDRLKKLYDLVDSRQGDFLTVTSGLNELMIITNKKYEKKALSFFPSRLVKTKIDGLSSITLNIPANSIDMLGLFYVVTRALNWENVNIIDIVSTFTEMTFIVRDKDVSRSYDVLKQLIQSK